MGDPHLDQFPVLADHVRLQPLTDYVKVVQVRSGETLHLSRREAVCLELARGDSSFREIAYLVGAVYRLSEPEATQLVESALELFGGSLTWRDDPTGPSTVSDPLRLFERDPDLLPPAPYRQERPSQLVLSVTAACNYRCGHCCNRSGVPIPEELRTQQWRHVIREAGELGLVSVTFSGGEPLTRPDVPELVAEAAAAGIYPILSTNASFIDSTTARDLAAAGLRFAHVSYSAATRESYDRVTGRRGWYDRALTGIRHLVEQEIYVRLKTVLLKTNIREVPDILDLARDAGVDEVHLAPYRFTHLAPAGSSLLLDSDDVESVVCSVNEWRRRTGSTLVVRSPIPEEERLAWDSPTDIVRCGGVKQELTVLPDGRITICEVLKDRDEFMLGHALHDGLRAVWQSSRPEQVIATAAKRASGPCASCKHLQNCGTGCFSLSLACGGDASSPDPRCWEAAYPDNPFRHTATSERGCEPTKIRSTAPTGDR
jgi:pyrroloquinoline quinone biosynthesis protein E